MRGIFVHNEELGAGGVRMLRTCHGDDTGAVLERIVKSVHCKFAWDAVIRTTGSVSDRVTALNHKSIDDAMKCKSVIKPFVYKSNKIIDCIGSCLREQLKFHDVAI